MDVGKPEVMGYADRYWEVGLSSANFLLTGTALVVA